MMVFTIRWPDGDPAHQEIFLGDTPLHDSPIGIELRLDGGSPTMSVRDWRAVGLDEKHLQMYGEISLALRERNTRILAERRQQASAQGHRDGGGA